MNTAFRNDLIKLRTRVQEDDFERFVAEELFPFFSKKYAGPNENTYAVLTSQSLLKGTKDRRKYRWLTVWSGPAERVEGLSFEHVLVDDHTSTETEDMLKKLESFGNRLPASILTEVVRQSALPEISAL